MRGDLSRFFVNLRKAFSSVLGQQGRVQLDADSDDKCVPIRRFLLFLEHSLDRALQWVGLEPNHDLLWRRRRGKRRR